MSNAGSTACKRIVWIFNGAGLSDEGVSGGGIVFQEVASRWQAQGLAENFYITTPGGLSIHRRLGLEGPALVLKASLFRRRERYRLARLYSYVVSTIHFLLVRHRVPPCDLVVSVSDYFCDVLPAYWLRRGRKDVRWISWIFHRETPPGSRPGNRWVNWGTYRMQERSFRKISRAADQVWVLDSLAGDDVELALRGLGMPANRMRKVKCGVNASQIQGTVATRPSVDAVMVGLRPNKGIYDIIPVWHEVQRIRPGTTLLLVGNRSDTVEQVLADIRAAGLSGVISFLGPNCDQKVLAYSELYGAMKSARVMFAPSHEEGWGIAVCEGLACGLAVAAYALPAYQRIYGDAISTVPSFDAKELARSVCRLLDDARLRQEYVRRGVARASCYSWEAVASENWGFADL